MANHMKEVAQLLGVELDQEFEVECQSGTVVAKITEDDILVLNGSEFLQLYNAAILLKNLIRGKYAIKPKEVDGVNAPCTFISGYTTINGDMHLSNIAVETACTTVDFLTPLTSYDACGNSCLESKITPGGNVKCPHCGDSYYMEGPNITTCVYYPPIWKDGVNVNPDRNKTTTHCTCMSCGKEFTI